MADEPLTLSSDELRRLGHRVVDLLVAHHEALRDAPPIVTGDQEIDDAVPQAPQLLGGQRERLVGHRRAIVQLRAGNP